MEAPTRHPKRVRVRGRDRSAYPPNPQNTAITPRLRHDRLTCVEILNENVFKMYDDTEEEPSN